MKKSTKFLDRLGTWSALGLLHVTFISLIAIGLALLVADVQSFKIMLDSFGASHYSPDWSSLARHFGYASLIWGTLMLGVFLLRRRNGTRRIKRVRVAMSRGTAMVETLIVMVPFLLMTSGIAQLAMINVAGLLSDLAAFQAARAAWLWQPEANAGRGGANGETVKFRARTAAALVLAPSAGADHWVGRNFPQGSGPPFRRIRTGITASFRSGFPVTGEDEWNISLGNESYFLVPVTTTDSLSPGLFFNTAFDSKSFHLRAGRKCTQAWMGLEDFEIVNSGDQIGVHFTYKYSLVFPWFAYIFGRVESNGARVGHYAPIEREFTLPKHPQL